MILDALGDVPIHPKIYETSTKNNKKRNRNQELHPHQMSLLHIKPKLINGFARFLGGRNSPPYKIVNL